MKRMLFVVLSVAFSTNLSSPIFPLYQAAYGLSTAVITVLFAVYAAGAFAMLLFGAAAAERVGPRTVALSGVGLAIVSALLFLVARSLATLLVARVVGGLAVGAFLGTSNSLLLHMTTPERRDSVMGFSSTLNLFGFGLGPALGGIWTRFLPGDPMRAPFVVLSVVLVAALLALLLLTISSPVAVPASEGKPAIRVGIPTSARALFWGVVGPAIFTGFAFSGLAFALMPGLARSVFGSAGRGVGGLLIFLMTTAGSAAQLVQKPASSRSRLAWGFAMLAAGSWIVVLGEARGQPLAILLAAVLQGVGTGWTFQASLRLAGAVAVQGDRVQVISTYFLCGYAGLSLPVVAAGELSRAVGVLPSLAITGAFLSALLLVAASFMLRSSTGGEARRDAA